MGYRPLTTRRIGHAPPSTVVPVNLLADGGSHLGDGDEVDEEPPPHGWSAHDRYAPSEVLLEDFSRVRDASKVHPLDPPLPLAASSAHAFEVLSLIHI